MAPHRHLRCIELFSGARLRGAGQRTPALGPIVLNTAGVPDSGAIHAAAAIAAPSFPAIAATSAL